MTDPVSSEPTEAEWIVVDDTEDDLVTEQAALPEAELENRLDTLRIRRLTKLRTSLYRTRSYAVIATIACLVGTMQAGVVAVRQFRAGRTGRELLLPVCVGFALAISAVVAAKKATALQRELSDTSARPPSD